MTLFTPTLSFFQETRSDSLGAYTFANVPNGTYQLACAALRLEYVEQVVQVAGRDVGDRIGGCCFALAGDWFTRLGTKLA